MADPYQNALTAAQFGDFEFDVIDAQDSFTRSIRVVEYQGVDGAQLVDQGRQPRTTTVVASFATEDQVERFRLFRELNDGTARLFAHPVLGAYRARITELTARVTTGEGRAIVASVTFTEDNVEDDELVIDDPVDVSSGQSAVTTLAERAAELLESSQVPPETTTAVSSAAESVRGWTDTAVTDADVNAQAAALLSGLDAGLRVLELNAQIESIDAHIALLRLRESIVQTAGMRARPTPTRNLRRAGRTPALTVAIEEGEAETYALKILDLNPGQSALGLVGTFEVPA